MVRCAKDSVWHVYRHVLPCLLLGVGLSSQVACAQLTMAKAVELAVHNSGRYRSAEADVRRANAALAVTKDIFIPSVVVGGGVGDAYGITLGVPTIFTINAQSLVYSAQQRFYIRAAHADFEAARLALSDAQAQAEEDAVTGYLSLIHAQQTAAVVRQQYELAQRLVSIVQDRVNGQLDSELELIKAQRTCVQLKLQKIRAEDDLAAQQEGMAGLLGIAADHVVADDSDNPPLPELSAADVALKPAYPDSPGILSAEANAKAKLERAEGDSRYTWRPQVTFGGQYGRISPIENVSEFYNLHGNYNSASAGVQIQLPILDRVRKAAARAATEDALKAVADVQGMRAQEIAGRRKLQRSLEEQRAVAELAELELKIAQTDLDTAKTQIKASAGGPVMTPKDEVGAQIQERQKYLDLLDARFQLYKSEVYVLRQNGELSGWIKSLGSGQAVQ
jgi:outer membrane protein TolC